MSMHGWMHRSDEIEAVAAIFRTLSDPTRLRILVALAEAEACVHELCDKVGMSQPAVSHQLRLLRLAHLVRCRREGREIYYAIEDEHVMELMGQARTHASHVGREPARSLRHAEPARAARVRLK